MVLESVSAVPPRCGGRQARAPIVRVHARGLPIGLARRGLAPGGCKAAPPRRARLQQPLFATSEVRPSQISFDHKKTQNKERGYIGG